jgi:hypothetical protein
MTDWIKYIKKHPEAEVPNLELLLDKIDYFFGDGVNDAAEKKGRNKMNQDQGIIDAVDTLFGGSVDLNELDNQQSEQEQQQQESEQNTNWKNESISEMQKLENLDKAFDFFFGDGAAVLFNKQKERRNE